MESPLVSGQLPLKKGTTQLRFQLHSTQTLCAGLSTLVHFLTTPFKVKPRSEARRIIPENASSLISLKKSTIPSLNAPESFSEGYVHCSEPLPRFLPASISNAETRVKLLSPGTLSYNILTINTEFQLFNIVAGNSLQEVALQPLCQISSENLLEVRGLNYISANMTAFKGKDSKENHKLLKICPSISAQRVSEIETTNYPFSDVPSGISEQHVRQVKENEELKKDRDDLITRTQNLEAQVRELQDTLRTLLESPPAQKKRKLNFGFSPCETVASTLPLTNCVPVNYAEVPIQSHRTFREIEAETDSNPQSFVWSIGTAQIEAYVESQILPKLAQTKKIKIFHAQTWEKLKESTEEFYEEAKILVYPLEGEMTDQKKFWSLVVLMNETSWDSKAEVVAFHLSSIREDPPQSGLKTILTKVSHTVEKRLESQPKGKNACIQKFAFFGTAKSPMPLMKVQFQFANIQKGCNPEDTGLLLLSWLNFLADSPAIFISALKKNNLIERLPSLEESLLKTREKIRNRLTNNTKTFL